MTWVVTEQGAGQVTQSSDQIVLHLPAQAAPATYHNAQVTSYHARAELNLHPPVRLEVSAQSQGLIPGTAGFGLWNHPFAPGERGLRLPRAAWFFFGAPPNALRLNQVNPAGNGCVAQTLDTQSLRFAAMLPLAPLAALLMRIPPVYRRMWPIAEWAMRTQAVSLDDGLLSESHHYALNWRSDSVTFEVDHRIVMMTRRSPKGPLGLIAWCDNQYAVATPQARFGWGLAPLNSPVSFILEGLTVSAL